MLVYFVLQHFGVIPGDLWPEGDREKGEEPDYIKTEREQFGTFRDLNKDGKMDKVRNRCSCTLHIFNDIFNDVS